MSSNTAPVNNETTSTSSNNTKYIVGGLALLALGVGTYVYGDKVVALVKGAKQVATNAPVGEIGQTVGEVATVAADTADAIKTGIVSFFSRG